MPQDLTDPITVALLAAEALKARGIRHGLYGGLALATYGEPRETRDADLAVLRDAVPSVQAAFSDAGLRTTVNFTDVEFGGLRISRYCVVGGSDTTGLNVVDLVVPRSPRFAAAMLDRVLRGPIRDVEVSIVAPEDYVLLKALSTRDRDLDDAASVLRTMASRVDLSLLEREEAALAAEFPDLAIRKRIEEIRRRSS